MSRIILIAIALWATAVGLNIIWGPGDMTWRDFVPRIMLVCGVVVALMVALAAWAWGW